MSSHYGLDYGEEVHHTRILREWSNMIGHKMGSLFAWGFRYGQDFSSDKLQAWMPTWQHFFAMGVS